MKRRRFITLLGGATAAWPLVARAQQGFRVAPLGDGVPTIHGRLPSNLESPHEGFQEFEIDNVVLDDQDVDGGHLPIKRAGEGGNGFSLWFGVPLVGPW